MPGPPSELQPMFSDFVLPRLSALAAVIEAKECRIFRVVGLGKNVVEKLIGLELAENPALEVGYCVRPNEVDFRLIGARETLDAVEPRMIEILGADTLQRDPHAFSCCSCSSSGDSHSTGSVAWVDTQARTNEVLRFSSSRA